MADEPFELIQTVVSASELLDILADAPRPIPLDELAQRARVAPPRAQRQLSTLTHLGLVERSDDEEPLYCLGWRAVRYGQRATEQHSLISAAFPLLRQLRDASENSVVLARRVDNRVVIWLSFESQLIPVVYIPTGATLDVRGSATGRAMLAHLDEATRDALVRSAAPLDQNVRPAGRIDQAQLSQRLETIRAQGYEMIAGGEIVSVSAPVFDSTNEVVAAVTMLGLQHLMADPPEEHAVRMVIETTRTLSSRLGHTAAE